MDEDFAIALSLQQFEDDDIIQVNRTVVPKMGLNENLDESNRSLSSRPLSIVDESWELIDPVPNIHELFIQFNAEFFEGQLAGVEVKWSRKMTLCAGLCCYEGRGGLCSIKLSEPLLKLRPRKNLVETLLHEMIHALLFVTHNNKDHESHGPEFHKHMYRINKQTGSNITVYHNFHDEVKLYRQHWWKCDGPCQKRPPFYGMVKRAMNREPSKNDPWWSDHLRTCGGKFIKIKEPEDYKKRGSKRKSEKTSTDGAKVEVKKKSPDTASNGDATLSKWFKPVNGSDASNPFKTDDSSIGDRRTPQKAPTVFSGNGHRLDGGNNTGFVSKEEWIENLVRRQRGLSGKQKTGFNDTRTSQEKPLKDIVAREVNQRCSSNEIRTSITTSADFEWVEKHRSTINGKTSGQGMAQGFQGRMSHDQTSQSASRPITRPIPSSSAGSLCSHTGETQSEGALYGKTTPVKTSLNSPSIQKDPSIPVGDSSVLGGCNSNPFAISKKSQNIPTFSSFGGALGNGTKSSRDYKGPKQKESQPAMIVINDSPTSDEKTKFVECPACPRSIPINLINAHLDKCLAQMVS